MEYTYSALDTDGKKISGIISAKDATEARSIIIAQKLDIITFSQKNKNPLNFLMSGNSRLSAKDLISILLNIGELDKIGMPMIHIIEILKDDIATGRNMKNFCKKIYNSVKSGSTLSDAFEKHKGAVDPIYSNFIRIAENIGNYHNIFIKVIEYIKWSDNIERTIKNIIIKGIGSIVFILSLIIAITFFVIPKTTAFLKDNGIKIPWYTQYLINMSDFIVNKYYYVIGIVAFIYISYKLLKRLPVVSHMVDLLKLYVPVLGNLIMNIESARFITFFSIMYDCGVRIEIIFAKVRDIVKNKHINQKMTKIEQMILNGSLPQDAIKSVAPFPLHVLKMMAIGFESGNISDVSSNVKYFLDRDIDEKTDFLVSSMKPIILIFTGILVGWMAISVFAPIYSNLDNMSGNQDKGEANIDA